MQEEDEEFEFISWSEINFFVKRGYINKEVIIIIILNFTSNWRRERFKGSILHLFYCSHMLFDLRNIQKKWEIFQKSNYKCCGGKKIKF